MPMCQSNSMVRLSLCAILKSEHASPTPAC
jgi:hypothetical protein